VGDTVERRPGRLLLHRPNLDRVPENREPDKCSELRWFPFNALPERMIAYCRVALDHVNASCAFSVYGW
jgi:8-oxo-dGTP diphosphatase